MSYQQGVWKPDTSRAAHAISATSPIGPATSHVQQILFSPFEFMRWLTFMVPVLLVTCGGNAIGGGGGFPSGNFNFPAGPGGRGTGAGSNELGDFFRQADAWISGNTGLVIAAIAGLLVIWAVFLVIFQWLGCRGEMIHLENVLTGTAAVSEPFERLAAPANSLFKFRLLLVGGWTLLTFPIMLLFLRTIISRLALIESDAEAVSSIFSLVGRGVGFVCIMSPFLLAYGLARMFTNDHIVPLVYRRGWTAFQAWGHLWELMRNNVGAFAVYAFARMVVAFVLGVASAFIALFSICLCIGCIPILNLVPQVPVYMWRRTYTILWLEQFGADWEVFDRGAPVPLSAHGLPEPPVAPV